MDALALQKLTEWLVDGARSAPSPPQMMTETCERLVAAGLPLWRVGVFVRTLHPDIVGRNFVWRPGGEVVVGSANYDVLDSAGISQQSARPRVRRAMRNQGAHGWPGRETFSAV